MANTLRGVGRAGAVRELKTLQEPICEGGEAKRSEAGRRAGGGVERDASVGMNDAEEPPSGMPANAECRGPAQVEEAIDLEKEWNELHEDWEGEVGSWQTMAWTMPMQS